MRRNATQTKPDKQTVERLPLAGIRVLDMTRVLAGVGAPAYLLLQTTVTMGVDIPSSLIAHRY